MAIQSDCLTGSLEQCGLGTEKRDLVFYSLPGAAAKPPVFASLP
jgi:hypothetical protein